jgi:hypothetical protein
VGAGARRQLAAGGLVAAERTRHLGEFEAERVVQQEARALERRQPFQHQHQRDRDVVGEIAGFVIVEGFVDHRLGQPLPDIDFAARLRRLHEVEAEPRHHGAEIAARLDDRRAIRGVPAQIGVLHHVLGFGARAEHAIGKPDQRAPMRLELRSLVVDGRVHAASVNARSSGRVSPPTVRRVQARPWPSAYFSVG